MINGNEEIKAAIDSALDFDVSQAEPIDLKIAGLNQREALLQLCDDAVVWRSPDGEAYVTVPVGDHLEHHAVASRSFKHWMLHQLARRYVQGGRPASANDNAVRDARAAVEARVMLGAPAHAVALRVVKHSDAIYIDLGTTNWSSVCVTPTGWSHVATSPVPLLRGRRTAAFAYPATKGDFGPLRRLLQHLDEEIFILFVSWCLGALLPNGPYPMLVLGGEQGSGKSTLARLAQRLTDPVNGDLLQPPGKDRDLIAAAKHNRVLAFDNLSSINDDLADSLCRLATGSEIGGRAMYTDHDTASFSASRPIIVNGIPDLAARGDLADRAIVLRLPPLSTRITERDWQAAVEAALAPTFGALLDALSCGLAALPNAATPDVRMADFAQFIDAAEAELPWARGAFLAAYRRSRQEATGVLAEGDSVATAIRALITPDRPEWSGITSELFKTLSAVIGNPLPADWPGNARWLSERLRRVAPTLRAVGIDFRERRASMGTRVTLNWIAPLATPAPPAPESRAAPYSDASGASAATPSDSEVRWTEPAWGQWRRNGNGARL